MLASTVVTARTLKVHINTVISTLKIPYCDG
ncbi:TPA: hypothetical protein JZG70_004538 [Escherichia coli]|nr:hypothetical protein [Escherichia coli]HAX5089354.1 hypothetical protein [Escherichia coli]HAX5103593.1 hypothetical protein [Escherichia coli]HAX5149639.1 hypothetical protein [Escherichia coli]HAX5293063.1 hypothetical protein [Escherichia coli]